ncbi:hypothetical protein Pelo_19813 [Pelomyxa schiedti]|nr:hypothetical protein Pelo_19813 [Pelomyxa schiedti]
MNWGSAPAILWLAELYPEVADEIIRKRGYTIMNVLCSHSGKYDSGQIAWGLQHTALNAKQVPACLKSLLLHQCYDNGFLLLDRMALCGKLKSSCLCAMYSPNLM